MSRSQIHLEGGRHFTSRFLFIFTLLFCTQQHKIVFLYTEMQYILQIRSLKYVKGAILSPSSDKMCTLQMCICFYFQGGVMVWADGRLQPRLHSELFCRYSDIGLLTRAHRNPVYKMVHFGAFCQM